MKAKDVMKSDHLWACSTTTDARQASILMTRHDVGCLPVLDDQGRLEGIITDRDIVIRVLAQGLSFETPVREVMSKPVHTIHPFADIREVESMMEQFKVRRLPVVDENYRLQGIISISDLARKYHGFLKEHRLAEVLEYVSTPS